MQRTNHQRKKKTSQYQKKQEHVLRAINTSECTYHVLVIWKHEAIFFYFLYQMNDTFYDQNRKKKP